MAARGVSMTRASTDSSIGSNIDVAEYVAASTPPTSLADSGASSGRDSSKGSKVAAPDDVRDEGRPKRSARAASGVSSYNLQKLSAQKYESRTVARGRMASGLVGRRLVDGEQDEEATPARKRVKKEMEVTGEPDAWTAKSVSPRARQKGKSVKDKVKGAVDRVGSVLGKRGRSAVQVGRRTLGFGDDSQDKNQNKMLKELDMGARGVLDELDLEKEVDVQASRPSKRARLSKPPPNDIPQSSVPSAMTTQAGSKKIKRWQEAGLYAGQHDDSDPGSLTGPNKLTKNRPGSSASNATTPTDSAPSKKSILGWNLPMFSYLDRQRDFFIPYDIFAPTFKRGDEKPKDWHQVNKNRLVGEAKELWDFEKLGESVCTCSVPTGKELGCDDGCLNRIMQYECSDDNCNLPANQCGNREFTELAKRMKKGGAFDIGVEVLKVPPRGFGVRACRPFAPGKIIMEYTGEIISEGECQRRMREDYKDKQCYYLMELEKGLIIDGTKGSMARFINHSCEPNCEVRMVKVNNTPRMAVFAGENGIVTGDELTYDYNFDNFGATKQACYCGAASCRGFLSKRLNAVEQKKLLKEENERKRKAAEEAQRHAEKEERSKKAKTALGPSWRGWINVDDPETKAKLIAEKKAKEEAERNSSRAQRMASRRRSAGVVVEKSIPLVKQSTSKRRKTTTFEQDIVRDQSAEREPSPNATATAAPISAVVTKKTRHVRTASSGSMFTEDLTRPESTQDDDSTTVKTTVAPVSEEDEGRDMAGTLPDPSVVEEAPRNMSGSDGEEKSQSLLDAATKTATKGGKMVLDGIRQAAKSTGLKSETQSAPNVSGGSGKMRQSTLGFSKMV